MVRIKGCKRCGGDLSLECDIYGVYAECIQCGANWSKTAMMLPTTHKEEESLKSVKSEPLVGTKNQY
ncbi:hypothetical protein ACFLWU_03185 [Chloroflexota bacterium]